MKLINIGCGFTRPQGPWINLDSLHAVLAPGTPERSQLDAEANYLDADLNKPLPFEDLSIDGILASHVFEHFDAQAGLRLMKECYRVMKPGASLLVSVPDASYFRTVDAEDRNSNWDRLFGQSDPNNPIPTFREAALWFNEHFAIMTEDALWSYFRQAGFHAGMIHRILPGVPPTGNEAFLTMTAQLNRKKFSLEMHAIK
jgi:predicted SAM-dependent methyltransferase